MDKSMKKGRCLGNILFWATLISPLVSFCLASMIGETRIFDAVGIIRYSWVMLLFIPIGILSILFGFKLKNNNQKCKKNFIIAFICLPLLILFGSYRFIFNSIVSYDVNEVSIIEEKIKCEMPDEIKVAKIESDLYDMTYVKIIDNESKEAFEQEIRNNQLWQKTLNRDIKGLLPVGMLYESESFDYFLFYDMTNGEYNTFPQSGHGEIIFIEYDCELQRLIILSDYTITE